MMVVDLQGIKTPEGYVLTDPVVLCEDSRRFGSTNLGKEGIKRCMRLLEARLGAGSA